MKISALALLLVLAAFPGMGQQSPAGLDTALIERLTGAKGALPRGHAAGVFMHIGGHGPVDKLATSVGGVFRAMRTTQAKPAPAAKASIDPAKTSLEPKAIEGILGLKGDFKDGVLRFAVGKPARMGGEEIGNAMGVVSDHPKFPPCDHLKIPPSPSRRR